MAELESKIKTIIRASSNCYQTVQEILKEASKEVVTILANNLEFMPEKIEENCSFIAGKSSQRSGCRAG